MTKEQMLSQHLPEGLKELGIRWWKEGNFQLVFSKHRKSKLGDYRFSKVNNSHVITVNRSLQKWSFLITYAHEVAHYHVNQKYGPKTKHHGAEWKYEFRILLLELISTGTIPDDLTRALAAYAKNPRASSSTYHPLTLALRKLESREGTNLYDLSAGNSFVLNGHDYKLLDQRRTRALCLQLSTGRKYLVSMAAEVVPID